MVQSVPLWEQPLLRLAAGDTLRPGGFTITDRAADFVGLAPGWPVLDVGSGLGATVERLRARYGAMAHGVEPSWTQLKRGRGTGQVQAWGDDLPFLSSSFRALFCECVLSLFPDAEQGLAEFNRVLQPGAFLLLSDLCGHGDPAGGTSCAVRALPRAQTEAIVEAAGFRLLLVEDHSRLLHQLAARLLFAGGEEQACNCGQPQLGYYLLVGQKKEE